MSDVPEKKRVKTSAPVEQVEIWEEEAEKMNVTRAEYIRLMMQAGRRQFPICENGDGDGGGIDIGEQVMTALREHETLQWDELVQEAVGDIEEQVEDVIRDLEDDGKVEVSLADNSVSLNR